MNFIPSSKVEKADLLKEIAVESVNDLFKDIPSEVRVQSLNIDKGLNEVELRKKIVGVSQKNKLLKNFIGAGSYNHFIPAVVDHIISRSEFYTAYTPYQPEISQGILQAIFEYQTMICSLTGQEVANASMYDGATAMAESCMMACNISRKNKILILDSVHPDYKEVVKTYCSAHSIELVESDSVEVCGDVAGVIVQSPDYYGRIHDWSSIKETVGDTILIGAVLEPTSLFVLKEPSACDIVVSEGQSFGNAMSFGGPYLGIIATKDKHKRLIPGRIVGQTVDSEGKKGYILTLQAREQHIRREKACSNICSNEALCALAATVYLAYIGKSGVNLGEVCLQRAHYLYNNLLMKGFSKVYSEPFYNEFVLQIDNASQVCSRLLEKGFLVKDLGDDKIMFCVTEMNSKEDIDELVSMI